MSVPLQEPAQLRAGLNWAWLRRDLADYPSPTWTLTYYFKTASGQFSLVATADGSGGFAISATAAATAAFAAGRYTWVAVVSAGSNKYQVDSGTLEVLPDFANSSPLDARSHARKMLEMIEAYLEDRNNLAARSYTIAGRTLDRYGLPELLKLRDRYKAMVVSEEHAERMSNGLPARNRILVRI